jgi:DNA polymerase
VNIDETLDAIDNLYGPPLQVISDCLRAMIVAKDGHDLIAADFANIEGRVLAWLAGEQWKVDAFDDYDAGVGRDLYLIGAERILTLLGRPPKEPLTKKSPERQSYGKVPELACGFMGGIGAFQQMARAYGVKMTDEEADKIKTAWRAAHPRIKQFWYDLENSAISAVLEKGEVKRVGKIMFKKAGSFLWCRLPSGRSLCYPYPRVAEVEVPWYKSEPEWIDCESEDAAIFLYGEALVRFDHGRRQALVRKKATKPALFHWGVDPVTKQWVEDSTYGGMLAENVTQAVARDILASALLRLEQHGYNPVLHVHDEVVCEVPKGWGSVDELQEIMERVPTWAEGLPIAVEGWRGTRYRK